MFKFWYEFIPKATSVIEIGQGERYYNKVVKPEIHSFMGTVFEEMCRYYTLKEGVLGKFGCFITNTGVWWGTETITNAEGKRCSQSADIDVVGVSEPEKKVILGECKFKNEKIDKKVYETLIRRGNQLKLKYHIEKYVLFSMSGFTEWFDSLEDNNVILLTLEDLYRQP